MHNWGTSSRAFVAQMDNDSSKLPASHYFDNNPVEMDECSNNYPVPTSNTSLSKISPQKCLSKGSLHQDLSWINTIMFGDQVEQCEAVVLSVIHSSPNRIWAEIHPNHNIVSKLALNLNQPCIVALSIWWWLSLLENISFNDRKSLKAAFPFIEHLCQQKVIVNINDRILLEQPICILDSRNRQLITAKQFIIIK